MGTRDTRVDAYIARSAAFARPILAHLREVVHAGCADVEETIKWGFPHFVHQGILCSMAAFKTHCAFGFWKAALLATPGRNAEAMGQFGRIESLGDLPPDGVLRRLVREAAALNAQGVARPRAAAVPKPPPEAPPDLLAALRRSRKTLANFEAFPPSHQRDYIEWITEARREDTRKRRIEAACAMISEGKRRNAKYERR